MSTSRRRGGGDERGERRRLDVEPQEMRETEDSVEIAVRLRNPLDRPVHYIADVRGILFDPATRRLRVQLSDQGRELVPGLASMEPQFRTVDPESEAVATIRLPKTIVKLAETQSPEGDVLFEEHAIADADEIELEIGWADTPYYEDPREKTRGEAPISAWEQDAARVTFSPREYRRDSS